MAYVIKMSYAEELYIYSLDPLLFVHEQRLALRFNRPPFVFTPELTSMSVEINRVQLFDRIPGHYKPTVVKVPALAGDPVDEPASSPITTSPGVGEARGTTPSSD